MHEGGDYILGTSSVSMCASCHFLTLYYSIESEHNRKVINWVVEEIPSGDYNQRDIKS